MITEKQKVSDQNNPTLRASSLGAPGGTGLRKGRGEGGRKELAITSDKFKQCSTTQEGM